MPTLPINLEVEAEAVGPVMIALRKMPGIIKMHLDLGEGPAPAAKPGNGNLKQTVLALFARLKGGPVHVDAIRQEIGGDKNRVYGVMSALKKEGVVQLAGKRTYQFTAKAMRSLHVEAEPLALPKPPAKGNGHAKPKAKSSPTKRAPQGAGPLALRQLLAERGPMTPKDVREALGEKGVGAKSMSGILDRSKRDGLIKKNEKSGEYELTAKGRKLDEVTAVAPATTATAS